jgi:tRNA G46 methylase TrmB
LYLQNRPVAAHTEQAIETLWQQISHDLGHDKSGSGDVHNAIMAAFPSGIILDSGCGTGRSTRILGQTYPQHLVLGVDRSMSRLTKTKDNQIESDDTSQSAYIHKVASNGYLIRAELVDFWRCFMDATFWTNHTSHHYFFYPNPYPTPQRLSQRWYAHPSFPLILLMNPQKVIVRSNWEGYLKEFSLAVQFAADYYDKEVPNPSSYPYTSNLQNCNPALPYLESAKQGPHERIDKSVAWTNFEAKYDKVGERTYELILHRRDEGRTKRKDRRK